MSIVELLRAVFINLTANKVKVLLTMLGIVVGTVTIVIVLAVGRGSQAEVAEQYKNLNVGTLSVTQAFGRNPSSEKLTDDFATYLADNTTTLKYITMVQSTRAEVSYGTLSTTMSVIGATEDLQYINNLEMAYGRFVNAEDNDSKSKVAVIGMTTAETYFEDDPSEAIGQSISIAGRKFEIVGVLAYQGDSSMRDSNPDESAIVPYSVAAKYMTGRMARPSVMVLTKDINSVQKATTELENALGGYYEDQSDSFMVVNSGSRLEAAQASAKTITLMLLVIAVIVLIVGGIGIMNVLFVSVKERTREIGILKAIGARKSDILKIFLYEAVFISMLGGIVGMVISFLALPIFSYFAVKIILAPFDFLIAMGFCISVGTFFGIYPAAKAANMKPIDALNYE